MVAIIVVNWKNYDDTQDCLKSLHQTKNTDFSIIVVDNESQKKPAEKLKSNFPSITLLPQKKIWALQEPIILELNMG